MARRACQSGMALVLVLTVLLALALIATPFVLSMLLQEKSATLGKEQTRADYGAEGARNFAVWQLEHGHDFMERRFPQPIYDSYYYDGLNEFTIVPGATLAGGLQTRDIKGNIWGVEAQDEQGKIDIRTAPPIVISRIETNVDKRSVNLKDYLSLYSVREARWIYPQRIRGIGTKTINGVDVYGLQVDNPAFYGRNSRLRITKPGSAPIEATVQANYAIVIQTDPQIPDILTGGIVEVEARRRVNLNTAPREVLAAIFEGLQLRPPGVPWDSPISRAQALQIADKFNRQQPIKRLEDFAIVIARISSLSLKQQAAVLLNAIDSDSALLDGSGTLSFIFKSFDVATLRAFSKINAPSGVSEAGRGLREVVAIAPPIPLTRFLESQYDFEQPYLFASAVARLPDLPQADGFPYGYRMTTFPKIIPPPQAGTDPLTYLLSVLSNLSDVTLKPLQSAAKGNEAYLQMAPSEDERGAGLILENGKPLVMHYRDTQEGKKLTATSDSWDWSRIFQIDPNTPNIPDVNAGGIELWVRFDSIVNPTTIFDIREDATSNRLSLRYENGELIFTAADATKGMTSCPIDDGTAEIHVPFTPVDTQTWTHLGAYWKGNQYPHLALLVDGFCDPNSKFMHYNPEGQKIMTKLGAPLSPTSTTWSVLDNSFMPTTETSIWRIGGELVVYDPSTGTLARGARGTQAANHPKDAAVQIFGYSSQLRTNTVTVRYRDPANPAAVLPVDLTLYNGIKTGGGTLTYGFGSNPSARVEGDKRDMTGTYVDATQGDIPVSGNIADYPTTGHIMIEQEVIFYTGTATATPGKFTGCQRGAHGTAAARHNTGQPVQLWGFAANPQANYLDRTILQIDDEWFAPMAKDKDHPGHWIGFATATSPAIPLQLLRGPQALKSKNQGHNPGAKVIPTWLARESYPNVVQINMGPGDRVTLIDAQNQREPNAPLPLRIQRAGSVGPPVMPLGQPDIVIQAGAAAPWDPAWQVAAFQDNVSKEYVADNINVRVLKFPSGELLSRGFLNTSNPQFSVGPMTATIDEVKFFSFPKDPIDPKNPPPKGRRISAATLGTTDTTLTLNDLYAMSTTGGALKIGDEIVAWVTGDPNNKLLQQCKRGWLNTTAQVHDAGDRVFDLSFLPITTLAADVGPTDRDIKVRPGTLIDYDPISGNPRRQAFNVPDGYALILQSLMGGRVTGEIFMYTEMAPNGDGTISFRMPPTLNSPTDGLFRGMFGTPPSSLSANSMVYFIPYRFWDTYKPQQWDNRMAYYQTSTNAELAFWKKVYWIEEKPASDPGLVTHVLARVDDKGEWFDATGSNVLEFTDPNAGNVVNRIGHENTPGQFDLRFYFEYRNVSGAPAFWPGHTWKRATRIREIMADYDQPTRTLYHEDR